jgi:hypothetical protein
MRFYALNQINKIRKKLDNLDQNIRKKKKHKNVLLIKT